MESHYPSGFVDFCCLEINGCFNCYTYQRGSITTYQRFAAQSLGGTKMVAELKMSWSCEVRNVIGFLNNKKVV